MTEIRKILSSEKDQYNNLIALSFISDPVARYMYPEPTRFLTEMPKFSECHGGSAVETGTAWTLDNFSGVCSWIPPNEEINEDALVAQLANSVYPDHLDNIWAFFEEFDKYVPKEPHWYLPMIGVDPRFIGQGIGTKLLNHCLNIIDEKSGVAFLGSSNPRNIPIYERFGFEVMGKIDVGPGVIATPMIRQCR